MSLPLAHSTRMYDVAPSAQAAWRELFSTVFARADIAVGFIAHGWPTPIGELWQRPGLIATFMCGWPFALSRQGDRPMRALAGVAPDFPGYGGLARYRSDFLVRAGSACAELADTFGARYGWMVTDSQSGWNAPRARLAEFANIRGGPLFAQSKGPYGNPRALIRALVAGEIDVTAVDGWYLDLLRAHDPEAVSAVKSIAHTPWTANPLLVASPDVDEAIVARVRAILLQLHREPDALRLLRAAHVGRFTPVNEADYLPLIEAHTRARASGYPEIA